ncbi:MAG: hypothetical protein R6V29_14105 [Spirochaetia bacterium]
MRSRFLTALRDDWRVLVATILGMSLFAVLVTVVAVLWTRPSAPEGEEGTEESLLGENARPQLPNVGIDDLAVPNEGRRLENWTWQRYRTPGNPWDEEEVDRFWVDPKEPALEYLGTRNDEEVERILQNVP